MEILHEGRSRRVCARKEIILSAGAIETPHLLLLSGIGPKEQLEKLEVRHRTRTNNSRLSFEPDFDRIMLFRDEIAKIVSTYIIGPYYNSRSVVLDQSYRRPSSWTEPSEPRSGARYRRHYQFNVDL